MASVDHIHVLGSRAALGCEGAWDGLVYRPPLGTHGRALVQGTLKESQHATRDQDFKCSP